MTGFDGSGRVPSWPRVKAILADRIPQAIALDGEPRIRFVVDGEHDVLSLRCEVPGESVAADFGNLDELTVQRVSVDGEWLDVRTNDRALFPYFVAFASTVADDIQIEGDSVDAALRRSLRLFRRLIRDTALLSDERQLGLLGELWVLGRLIGARGSEALGAWVGPSAESHDFRWGATELEVKATRRQQRRHIINGLDQLKPSVDSNLFLVSLQFAAAGPAESGESLSDAVRVTRELLRAHGQDGLFDAILLDRFHLTPETEHRYVDRLKLRSEVRLIEVEKKTPRLLKSDLDSIPRDEMHRVIDADYTLDCEGMGVPDGAAEFLEVIP